MADSGEEFVRISHRDLVNLAKLRTSAEMSRAEKKNFGKQQEETSKNTERQTCMPGQKKFDQKRDEAGKVLPTVLALSPETSVARMAVARSSPDATVTCVTETNELQLDKCDNSKFVSLKSNPAQRKPALQEKSCHTLADYESNCRPKDKNSDNTERQQNPVVQVVCKLSSVQVQNSGAKSFDGNADSVADRRRGDAKKDWKLEQEKLKLEERRERKRDKKPDIQLYVPKGRQQMLLTKDAASTPVLHRKLSDASCATEPVVTSEGVDDVNTSKHQRQFVTDGAERRVTTEHESEFQATILISEQENTDNCRRVVKKVGGAVRKRRQQKNKGRKGDFHGRSDSRMRRKVVHDGRNPGQKHQHKLYASGVGNRAGDDDLSEVEELEWDHQADLDLEQSEMNLLAATQKQDSNVDAFQLKVAELQLSGSLVKPTGENMEKKLQRKHHEGKPVALHESVMTDKNDLCFLPDKATKPKSCSLRCENIRTIGPTDMTNKDENFEGKFDLMVITNSGKLYSPSVKGIMHQYGYKHESDDTQPFHVDDSSVTVHDNSLQSSKTDKLKMQILKKDVRDRKSCGTKYDSSRKTGNYNMHGMTCEDELNCRVSADSKGKTGRNNAQELVRENPSITDKNSSARVGGIIRLPAGTTTSVFLKLDHASSHSHHAQQHGIKGHAKCRTATRRTLWDPSQPVKGTEPSTYFVELPDVSEQFAGEANKTSREYEHVKTQKLQLAPHPFYGSLASSNRSLPVGNYNYRYRGPPCFDGSSSYDASSMNDLYFQRYDQNGQPLHSSELSTLVKEATMFDSQLTVCLAQGINSGETLKRMTFLRKEILTRYEQVMLLDLDFCNQQNIGDALWRSAFYQVIEVFRKQIKDSDSETKSLLLTILDESLDFFEKLLQKVQVKYNFSLEKHQNADDVIHECVSRTVKLGLIACQRIMMCLGDLERYKELVNQSSNYGRARSWYMKAQQIAPKNGKPYNQLAVLALYTRRKLDAVYYYMRSLAATNPLLTARESLMSLFDEARRKMEQKDRNRQLEKAQRKRMKQCPSEESHRLEIWILPDGSSSQDHIRDDDNDSDDLLGLSVVELNKRFVLSFLHVHGKLFMKIGMETFPESVGRMLQEFQTLIQHSPSPIGWMRLLQLMTINMFAIENTIRKEASCLDGSCRSVMQEQAMQLGLEMFGLLIEQCIHLLHEYLKSYGSCLIVPFGEDLHQILPCVKAWSDWMICHSNLWNPPPAPFDPLLGPSVDLWRLMADLFNIISELNTSAVVLDEKKKDGCKPVVLLEDVVLAGFIPLLSITHSPVYILNDVDKDLAQDCLHIDKLRTFAEIVYGLDPAILSYSAETRRYSSTVASRHKDEVEEIRKIADAKDMVSSDELNDEQEKEGVTVEGHVLVELGPTTISEDDGQEHHISQLKARKQELTRKFAEQMKKQENLQAAFESSHQDFRRIELEIRPVFLVLDTNCLIDHIRNIQKLLATRKYTFVIPLVVINELDGLAKNLKESCYDTIEQAEMVRTSAEMAVQFLEVEFESRNPNLRAITSKGSTLDTIAFRSEEPQDAGTNDDLILSCCLRHCQDKARDFMPKSLDEPIRLYRDVVLLTNDRNLRLKAHLHNVPVKDIPSFIKWANIS